jgi:hypothetical protein
MPCDRSANGKAHDTGKHCDAAIDSRKMLLWGHKRPNEAIDYESVLPLKAIKSLRAPSDATSQQQTSFAVGQGSDFIKHVRA